VRRFIHENTANATPTESFDSIAVDIAKHQHASATGIERLFHLRKANIDSITHASQIPAVPTDVFKLRRVACHPPDLDQVVFKTSGTTIGARGTHALRDVETYRAAARAWAGAMLHPDTASMHWIVLAPEYENNPGSSLGFMLADLSTATGGVATWAVRAVSAVRDGSLDIDLIACAIDKSRKDGVPAIVAGASFAFVYLLDELGGKVLPLPGGRAMQTGGFKGRSRTVDGEELRADIASAFGFDVDRVVSEYGMTELGSQAYDGGLCASLGMGGRRDVFSPPPWMRVVAVSSDSLEPVDDGQVGIARVEDLTNVDSAVVVQTSDRIVLCDGGFRLLGRLDGAPPRGCSIGIDEILQSGTGKLGG